MDYLTLTEGLGIPSRSVVALVGGGGKTTTLRRLCLECGQEGRRVLATTTTRMKMEDLSDMRDVLFWDEKDPMGQTWTAWESRSSASGKRWIDRALAGAEAEAGLPATFLGRSIMRDKIIGLPADHLGELLGRLSWDHVVVEADGSRGKSVKGHRLGEPAFPLCATHCVIVLGADALGVTLNDDHVHRPEIVQDLLGLPWGAPITAEKAAELLSHPRGILGKIPGDVEVLVYVNKAPMGPAREAVKEFARILLSKCG
ncbi:MAG: selenium cofactor biosynthesis protein YqeC, partial [Gemmatimonadota bacterium]|nr:selenium cofactor biosynthesis protein YqeC [Gemmatimonadota bacterium]